MFAIDFEYDGQYLSDFGFIVCEFGNDGGLETVSAGSTIVFAKVPQNGGHNFNLVSTKYEKCIQTSFDICKDPDKFNRDNMEISNDEYRELIRWLNRHEFLLFHAINDDERDICYYHASFNVEKIYISGKLYGLRLTMETDSPFGLGSPVRMSHTFTNTDIPMRIVDFSDDTGSSFPIIQIVCDEDGDLKLFNDLDGLTMEIRNCKAGEEIIVDCKNQIITTSYNSHDIANDFNYEFLTITNTYKNRVNNFYSSLRCAVVIEYEPTIKDSP